MRRWCLLLVLAAVPLAGQAQPRAADLVRWTVTTAAAAPGAAARVTLRATIAPGWRLYAMESPVGRPLAVEVETLPAGVAPGVPQQATPHEAYDEAFGETYTYFTERAEMVLPLRVARAARPGRHSVVGTVHYAVCDDSICLPPAATPFRTILTVR